MGGGPDPGSNVTMAFFGATPVTSEIVAGAVSGGAGAEFEVQAATMRIAAAVHEQRRNIAIQLYRTIL